MRAIERLCRFGRFCLDRKNLLVVKQRFTSFGTVNACCELLNVICMSVGQLQEPGADKAFLAGWLLTLAYYRQGLNNYRGPVSLNWSKALRHSQKLPEKSRSISDFEV